MCTTVVSQEHVHTEKSKTLAYVSPLTILSRGITRGINQNEEQETYKGHMHITKWPANQLDIYLMAITAMNLQYSTQLGSHKLCISLSLSKS